MKNHILFGATLLIATSALGQNLFVGDGNVYEFAPNGLQSTFASGLGAGALTFNSAGDLFETGLDNHSINEFTPNGTESLFASGLGDAEGLAFNNAGDLFVADGYIYEYSPTGVRSTFSGFLDGTRGLAFNNAGDLFVAAADGDIYELTPSGAQSTFATGLSSPWALAFNNAGDLFVSDYDSGDIYEFTPDGTRTTFATGLNESPIGLAFQPAPEPSALWLVLLGSGVWFYVRSKKCRNPAVTEYSARAGCRIFQCACVTSRG